MLNASNETPVLKALEKFRRDKVSTAPRLACTPEQLKPISEGDGLYYVTEAPMASFVDITNQPPTTNQELPDKKYLWVIMDSSIPFAKEIGIDSSERKHTNITGGDKAYCGGEFWFASYDALYLNGGSGRYPCETDEQLLTDTINLFGDLGYKTAVPPFSEDNGRRPRVFKSEAQVIWNKPERIDVT